MIRNLDLEGKRRWTESVNKGELEKKFQSTISKSLLKSILTSASLDLIFLNPKMSSFATSTLSWME